MAYYVVSLLCFFLFFILTLLTNTEGQGVPAGIIVFGDSLLDVGNNNHLELSLAKANFRHNGVDFAHDKATGRFSNGKNAADFLAEKLGLPTSPPYLAIKSSNKATAVLEGGGISFASGGAGILNETDKLFRQSISFNQQIEYYSRVHGDLMLQLGTVAAESYLAKSIFFISMGSNDILGFSQPDSDLRKEYTSPQQYIDTLILTQRSQLKQIYDLGARKFAVLGAGAIGCCPSLRSKSKTGECNEEANFLSVRYNHGVMSLLQELKAELKDFNYSFFNTYDINVDFVQQPALYGFTEVKTACCGGGKFNGEFPCLPVARLCRNRRVYLFWDFYHPGEAGAQIVIDIFFNGTQYTHPINVKQLLEM